MAVATKEEQQGGLGKVNKGEKWLNLINRTHSKQTFDLPELEKYKRFNSETND